MIAPPPPPKRLWFFRTENSLLLFGMLILAITLLIEPVDYSIPPAPKKKAAPTSSRALPQDTAALETEETETADAPQLSLASLRERGTAMLQSFAQFCQRALQNSGATHAARGEDRAMRWTGIPAPSFNLSNNSEVHGSWSALTQHSIDIRPTGTARSWLDDADPYASILEAP